MKNKFRALQLVLGLFLTGCFTLAWADHFKPLSPNHTSYGVAQFNYGNLRPKTGLLSRPVLKLMNPNHVAQAAAALIYSSDRGRRGTFITTEVFLGCRVTVVTPHGSSDINEADFNTVPFGRPLYGEVIWAPLDKVSPGRGNGQNRRIADGLGGAVHGAVRDAEGAPKLAHPGLFTLPSDSVVAGQRQAAINCICSDVATLGLSPDIFSEFGIDCP